MKSPYQEAYDKWVVDQTPENMSGVLDTLMPTINSEIMRYEGPKSHLRSKAKALAVKAVKTFNPMGGAKLQSWVVTNLQPLSRYGQGLRDVKAPELAIRGAAEVARVTSELSDDLGRDPTDEEVADEIGISVKKVRRLRRQVVPSVASGSMELVQDEDGGSSNAPGVSGVDRIPYAQDAVYMSLSPRDRFIFDSRTGMHGSPLLPVSDVARRLGVSSAAVSQRANTIAGMIREMALA